MPKCWSCKHYVPDNNDNVGCELKTGCKHCIDAHVLRGGGCFADPPLFLPNANPTPMVRSGDHRKALNTVLSDAPRDDVAIVTFHFNPVRYRNQSATYYRWRPSLGRWPVRCYELVFDDDQPEIEGSIVIRGTRSANLLWQKEALINRALKDTPANVRYFSWIDHDIVSHDPHWVSQAITKIDSGVPAVQLFATVRSLDPNDKVESEKRGAVKHGTGSPGGLWMANRDWLDRIGGVWPFNIVGGGDVAFCDAVLGGQESFYIKQHRGEYQRNFVEWVAMAWSYCNGVKADYLDATTSHIYHGTRQNRQYIERERIIRANEFDPFLDVRLNSDGILEWSSDKPDMHDAVRVYFEGRREDG